MCGVCGVDCWCHCDFERAGVQFFFCDDGASEVDDVSTWAWVVDERCCSGEGGVYEWSCTDAFKVWGGERSVAEQGGEVSGCSSQPRDKDRLAFPLGLDGD